MRALAVKYRPQTFEEICGQKSIVKILDRCNNISSMATAFSSKKMEDYLRRTEKYVYPLFDRAEEMYPDCLDKHLLQLLYQHK